MDRPRKTRAAILVQQRQPLEIAEIDLPSSLDVGQVLVKVHTSGICGSQLGEIDGAKGEDRYLPHLLGHEGAGTVLETGAGVRHVKPGDKVVMHWRKGQGIEAATPAYGWSGKRVNAGWVTTFNEHAVVSENRLTPIPADSDLEVAALFGCAVTTGFGVVINNARLTVGESVVVFGAGGIGLSIVQAASMVSADPIIAVDLHDPKLALARMLGATHTVNASNHDPRQAIADALAGVPLDVFVDNTGNPDVIQLGYELTQPEGRVVLVGVPPKGRNVSLHSLPLHFGKSIAGSHGGEAVPHVDIPRYHRLYREGRLPLRELITDCFRLDQVNDAIAAMRRGSVRGRCLLTMG